MISITCPVYRKNSTPGFEETQTFEGTVPASEFRHGTTCVAVRYADGVLLAGDRRATSGNLISHRALEKVFPADRHSGVAIAGGFGSVIGTFFGALILAVVTSAATGLVLSPDWQFILKAVAVFLAIVTQTWALARRNR